MDRNIYRVMAPFHRAQTREKAVENVRAGENWHSYELFARYVLPRFEERSAWRSQSMDWMCANHEALSAKRKAATASAVEQHFAEERRRKGLEAAK